MPLSVDIIHKPCVYLIFITLWCHVTFLSFGTAKVYSVELNFLRSATLILSLYGGTAVLSARNPVTFPHRRN